MDEYPQSGIYEYYKSTPEFRRYYQVLGVGRHTETDELLVFYIPLYYLSEHTGPKLQARPLDMFIEDIEHNGKTMPRFAYLGIEIPSKNS